MWDIENIVIYNNKIDTSAEVLLSYSLKAPAPSLVVCLVSLRQQTVHLTYHPQPHGQLIVEMYLP